MNGDEEVLARLQIMEKGLQEKLDRLRKPLLQVEEDLQHVLGTIAFLKRDIKPADSEDGPPEEISRLSTKLKGMTQLAAVITIAKARGGKVRTQDAKRLMIKAGIMSATKNATNMTHNVISRSNRFQRIAPGEYMLRESEHESDESLTIRDLRRPQLPLQ